jgi:hypothetical protein
VRCRLDPDAFLWPTADTMTMDTHRPYHPNMVRDLVGADHMVMGDRAVSSIERLHIPARENDRVFRGTALSILANV